MIVTALEKELITRFPSRFESHIPNRVVPTSGNHDPRVPIHNRDITHQTVKDTLKEDSVASSFPVMSTVLSVGKFDCQALDPNPWTVG